MHQEQHKTEEHSFGRLPQRAPLAVPFVPFQENNPPQYNPNLGLARGTIFPGLDLPFKNNLSDTHPYEGTSLGEIMSLGLALTDLHLYLDTHPDDQESFAIFQYYSKILEEKQKAYTKNHGPLTLGDVSSDNYYSWLNDPWPWEYVDLKQEGK